MGREVKIKGIIIFSSKFNYQPSILLKKIRGDKFLRDYTIILFEAKALFKLIEENEVDQNFINHFPWHEIINPSEKVIIITGKNIETHFTSARRSSKSDYSW